MIPLFPMNLMNYNEKPPTLYSVMDSIVNYNREDKIKIPELAKYARETIFNFNYPLDSSVDKEEFECIILNHFIKRRIGTETVTEFRINLNVKLNSIMPIYNKMFNVIANSNGFGETIEKTGNNNKKINSTTNNKNIMESTTEATTNGTNTQENVLDSRNSDLPQSNLENLQNGSYVSNYNYNKENNKNNIDSKDNSTSSTTNTQNGNSDTEDNTNYTERTTRTNILEIYNQLSQNLISVYDMIFKELDVLFYQLV